MNQEILEFVYALKREGIKYDLKLMKQFDLSQGLPHKSYKNIHITGTNGKGSVSSMIFNILRMSNKTGLYTSPHLIKFNERILSHDRFITDDEMEEILNLYLPAAKAGIAENRNPTFFEITTELAFQHFKNSGMQWASIEVGLGGRLDATNVIIPELSVITKIGYEHTDKLGTTLRDIAYEKSGIIKEGKPAVTGERKPEPLTEIQRIADRRNSRLIRSWEYVTVKNLKSDAFKTEFQAITPFETYDISLNLAGKFQVENACMAISAIENCGISYNRKMLEDGMSNARWPGRLQVINQDPLVMVDSSHNPPAATTLSKSINELVKIKPVLVVGMLSDKDHYSYLHNISSCSDSIILTTPDEENRAIDPWKLKPIADGIFKDVKVIEDPVEAYEYSIARNPFTLITGSMYLTGKILQVKNIDMMPFNK